MQVLVLKLYFGLYRLLVDGLGVKLHTLELQLVKKLNCSYALTYTGVEGVSVSYGSGEVGGILRYR